MTIRWFLSSKVRHATDMKRHVQKILNAQRDILSPQAIDAVETALNETERSIRSDDNDKLIKQVEELEKAANKWLKPYPNASWRENVEVLLVAIAIAMAVRTFFLQPFKIPTGSMQPTLYGITSVPDFTAIRMQAELDEQIKSRTQDELNEKVRLRVQAEFDEQIKLRDGLRIPSGWQKFKNWIHGASYVHIVAESDGALEFVGQPTRFLIFNLKQTLVVGGKNYTIWFPPDYGNARLEQRAGLQMNQFFRQGEDIIKMQVNAGDHLFVDRLTYNFRKPARGDIVVFETKGIEGLKQDEFYIKRLVGLGGETLGIGNDRHTRINGMRLDAATPHFENLYSFDPTIGPRESHFSGHTQCDARDSRCLLADEQSTYQIKPQHLFVMGDNTMNSLDSRFWGDFSEQNVIGRSWFVYWPIGNRFGWSSR